MNTYITLNINLSASKHLPEGAELSLEHVKDYIQESLGEPSFIGVSHGETARTIVLQYKYVDFVRTRLYSLARDLKLDYIAYRIQDGTAIEGEVLGEYAHEYNEEFVEATTDLSGCSGTPLQPDTQGKGTEMHITLNIGLDVSKNYLPDGAAGMQLQYQHVKEVLEKTLGKPSYIGVSRSATERTVVVQYTEVKEVLSNLFSLAQELKQDCIAYSIQDDDGTVIGGALVGKYAHEWNYGVFNEAYFIPA